MNLINNLINNYSNINMIVKNNNLDLKLPIIDNDLFISFCLPLILLKFKLVENTKVLNMSEINNMTLKEFYYNE
jgi:hypothetical protein